MHAPSALQARLASEPAASTLRVHFPGGALLWDGEVIDVWIDAVGRLRFDARRAGSVQLGRSDAGELLVELRLGPHERVRLRTTPSDATLLDGLPREPVSGVALSEGEVLGVVRAALALGAPIAQLPDLGPLPVAAPASPPDPETQQRHRYQLRLLAFVVAVGSLLFFGWLVTSSKRDETSAPAAAPAPPPSDPPPTGPPSP